MRKIAPVVRIGELNELANEKPLNKTDFFKDDPVCANKTCFSNNNIEVKESSGQIVLLNGQSYTLGLGGYAAFDMTKNQKIAICRGTLRSNNTFNTAIKRNKVYSGNITIFT